jgi:hypothetical protein
VLSCTRYKVHLRNVNLGWEFLCHLHEVGRARADKWLATNFEHFGNKSTVDVEAKYFDFPRFFA